MSKFSKQFRELKKSQKLSQRGLGLLFDIKQPVIGLYDNGEREPDLDTLIDIAKYFDVSFNYLLGLTDIQDHCGATDKSSDPTKT